MARFYTDEHGFLRWESESGIVDKKVIYIAQWMQTFGGGYVFDGKYKFLNLCFPEFMVNMIVSDPKRSIVEIGGVLHGKSQELMDQIVGMSQISEEIKRSWENLTWEGFLLFKKNRN